MSMVGAQNSTPIIAYFILKKHKNILYMKNRQIYYLIEFSMGKLGFILGSMQSDLGINLPSLPYSVINHF